MNWSEMQEDWEQMKALIQSHWPHLTAEELAAVNADRDKLATVLQGRYGFTTEETENAICEFEKDVRRPGAVK